MSRFRTDLINKLAHTLLLWLVIYCLALPQSYRLRNYSVDDGLPSAEVYDILQDSEGYMWFATGFGVCRYDGYDFKTYTTQDGLLDNSIVSLYNDPMDRVWLNSYTGYLCYFEAGQFHPIPLADSIAQLLSNHMTDYLMVEASGKTWMSCHPFKTIYTQQDSSIQLADDEFPPTPYHSIIIKPLEEGVIFKYQNASQIRPAAAHVLDSTHLALSIPFTIKAPTRIHIKRLNQNTFIGAFNSYFFVIKNKQLKCWRYFKNRIFPYPDSKGNIWICEENNGLFYYPNGDTEAPPIYIIKNISPSKIFEDREHNFWISTLGDGVFLLPSNQFNCYAVNDPPQKAAKVLNLSIADEELVLSTNEFNLYRCNREHPNNEDFKLILHNDKKRYITDIYWKKPYLYLTGTEHFRYRKNGSPHPKPYPVRSICYDLESRPKDNSLFLACRNGFYQINGDTIKHSKQYGYTKHTRCLMSHSDSVLWIGSIHGLYQLKNGQVQSLQHLHPAMAERITAIDKCKNSTWIGTRGAGAVVIKNDHIIHLSTSSNSQMPANMINSIYCQNDSTVWMGTNKGLIKISIHDPYQLKHSLTHYTIWDGLPSNEINSICSWKNKLWLATNNGLVSFRPNQLQKSSIQPLIKFTGIEINHKPHQLEDTIALAYNQNNLVINYKGISFKDPGNITYHYIMKGVDNEMIETKSTTARYTDLAPGHYSFYLKARNANGIWTNHPISFTIAIGKHFTQTLWFRILILSCIILLILGIFLLILSTQRHKAETNKLLITAKQKLFRSQMSPHFIFNSLIAIQSFMYKNNTQEAAHYLSRFAKLIRLILVNSREDEVSLAREINTLEHYLSLQKLRFNNRFDYQIIVDDKIDRDLISIPPMLAQPFIENCVEHGFQELNEPGIISIHFTIQQQNIKIEICDNGIGIERGMELSKQKQDTHSSLAMTITEERLNLLNRRSKNKIHLSISEIKNENKIKHGTRVIFIIPFE